MIDLKWKTKDNMKTRMDIPLFCHNKNKELVYDGSRVTKPKTTFVLDKNVNYWSPNGWKICVFLMDILWTYLD